MTQLSHSYLPVIAVLTVFYCNTELGQPVSYPVRNAPFLPGLGFLPHVEQQGHDTFEFFVSAILFCHEAEDFMNKRFENPCQGLYIIFSKFLLAVTLSLIHI